MGMSDCHGSFWQGRHRSGSPVVTTPVRGPAGIQVLLIGSRLSRVSMRTSAGRVIHSWRSSASWFFLEAVSERSLRVRLLGTPEHQLLQPVLLLWLLAGRRNCCRRSLWAEFLAGLGLWAKRSTHQLRQALDAGALTTALSHHVRVESAGRA